MDDQRQEETSAVRRLSGEGLARAGWWWLRSPGNNQNNAANVNTDGSVNRNGNNVSNDNNAVRPAFPQMPETQPDAGRSAQGEKAGPSLSRGGTLRKNRDRQRGGRLGFLRMAACEWVRAALSGERARMSGYDAVYDFRNLYKAHLRARKGKRGTAECIAFELELPQNLSRLQEELRNRSYQLSGYYRFEVFDPKRRAIHALHYRDRVVQHCLCDEVLAPVLEKRLIFDNAACRVGKGTDFARARLSGFLREHFSRHGTQGYFLKCDVRKFFDNINHNVLKGMLGELPLDPDTLALLHYIIDSYHTGEGMGIPLGNQTSQWFALYTLDPPWTGL